MNNNQSKRKAEFNAFGYNTLTLTRSTIEQQEKFDERCRKADVRNALPPHGEMFALPVTPTVFTGKNVVIEYGIENAGEVVWHPVGAATTKTAKTYTDNTQHFGENYK